MLSRQLFSVVAKALKQVNPNAAIRSSHRVKALSAYALLMRFSKIPVSTSRWT
jgi:hypothetical protein